MPKPDASNVRKYMHQMAPSVLCFHSGKGLFRGFPLPPPERLPLLANVADVFMPTAGADAAQAE